MSSTTSKDTRPPPKDLSHHLSRNAKSRQPSSIKQFYKYFAIPGIGQLAGGLPNQYYFPFDTLEAKVALPERWKPTDNKPVDPPSAATSSLKNGSPLNQPQSALKVPHTSHEQNPLKKIDLASALQYGQAQGYPPLYSFLRQFSQENLHPNCPYKGGPEIVLTCGSTDGFSKALAALSNEWSEEKDWVRDREGLLVEEFCYMNAIQAARPRGLNIAPVKIDDEGMLPEGPGGLRDVLENWDYKKGKRPHLMYTVTMGQNPTSGVLSLQRRRELYALCSKYDVIIVEDDPYWYLQFPSSTNSDKVFTPQSSKWKSSGYDFLDSLVPSYISVDTDGRVLRLDTFSKTVAPGCRLGWITGQPALIERILRLTETSTQQPSGFVQSMIAELIIGPQADDIDPGKGPANGKGWNTAGWVRWLEGLRGNYERRMNDMCRVLDTGRELVKVGRRNSLSNLSLDSDDDWAVVQTTTAYSFDWPVGGMFVWLKMHFSTHPLAAKVAHARLSRALWIFWTTKPYLVLVSPGLIFSPTDEIRAKDGYKYFRLCFAACDDKEIVPISQRFVDAVNDFWKIKSVRKIDELLEEEGEGVEQRAAGQAEMAQLASFMGPC
ncbi:aromatic amino acid aminotransferas-like protein, partial [Aureobasidium melanogenum]